MDKETHEERIMRMWEFMQFPSGINYCDWVILSQEEKNKLWKEYKERIGKS